VERSRASVATEKLSRTITHATEVVVFLAKLGLVIFMGQTQQVLNLPIYTLRRYGLLVNSTPLSGFLQEQMVLS